MIGSVLTTSAKTDPESYQFSPSPRLPPPSKPPFSLWIISKQVSPLPPPGNQLRGFTSRVALGYFTLCSSVSASEQGRK